MVKFEVRLDGEVVAKVEVDANLIAQIFRVEAPAEIKSTPLNKSQVDELLAGLDDRQIRFCNHIAANDGWITWGEVKQNFGVRDWDAFTDGPGREINAALQNLVRDKSARLFWRDEKEWFGREEGENEVCKIYVDGAALAALRQALQP